MKHLKIISLLLVSVVQANVIHISPDDNVCSMKSGIDSLSKGIVEVSETGDTNLQLEGVNDLLSGITNIFSVRMRRSDISNGEKSELCDEINKINDLITMAVDKAFKRSQQANNADADKDNHESEKKTILEGLKQIVSGVISMAMGSGSVKPFLTMVLSGVMKIVGAIFADGKVDNQDWANVKDAVSALLTGKRSMPSIEGEEVFF
jgi:hypothetical protein